MIKITVYSSYSMNFLRNLFKTPTQHTIDYINSEQFVLDLRKSIPPTNYPEYVFKSVEDDMYLCINYGRNSVYYSNDFYDIYRNGRYNMVCSIEEDKRLIIWLAKTQIYLSVSSTDEIIVSPYKKCSIPNTINVDEKTDKKTITIGNKKLYFKCL